MHSTGLVDMVNILKYNSRQIELIQSVEQINTVYKWQTTPKISSIQSTNWSKTEFDPRSLSLLIQVTLQLTEYNLTEVIYCLS